MMENKTGNESAYPTLDWGTNQASGEIIYQQHGGLTKREYFAGLAMQGLCANTGIIRPNQDNEKEHSDFADVCIMYADALLKQLSNPNK